MRDFVIQECKCKTCKSHCIWAGKEESGHGKCLVGYTPLTHADLIRAMSDEELAEFMRKASGCGPVWDKEYCHSRPKCGDNCWLDWLRQETPDG